ncbi:MAG: ferrous iron transporter B [Clostridia bacterium]|nr:ferrous iron transporter B [Clostridia bacterium]
MNKNLKIALAGNPNSGKTTLFNALTGSNQFIGNWPGVTVEKKEGKLKKRDDVTVTDLPGIYSLSPYTLEEVVARNYLITERPDAILNIVDGTNLERNLYLTTQLIELGIPVVIAINMMDIIKKNGDKLNTRELSAALGCPIVEISALRGTGIQEAANAAIEAAKSGTKPPSSTFSGSVEHALAHIEDASVHSLPEERRRWYAVKLFERDQKVLEELALPEDTVKHIEKDIAAVEVEFDDDSESILTNERYVYIASLIKDIYKKKSTDKLTVSDRIDRVVTDRRLALPIFALVMFLVYYLAVSKIGGTMTDWTNDNLFGDGFHLLGIGQKAFDDAADEFAKANIFTDDIASAVRSAESAGVIGADEILGAIEGEDYEAFAEAFDTYGEALDEAGFGIGEAVEAALKDAPAPEDYGVFVPGIPVLAEKALEKLNTPEWLNSLVIDGVIAGVGAVLGFLPQMLVVFLFLALLEECGYMARVAFVMDRIFRRFGLSGKSFIPMLIGVGCGVPGIMASRTIESERDRRMTIMTTTFIPCGAKIPIIALIAGALFNRAWWVAPSAYFIGFAAIVISGIILKKTKMFSGDPAPFVMELPAYHMPRPMNVLRSMWERGWSFVKKAGTVIFIATIFIWAASRFGIIDGSFVFDAEMELSSSILGRIGGAIKWIFAPLGFGSGEEGAKAAVATIMGLVAKEEVVGVFGVLDFGGLSKLAGYAFLIFNLLCAPCFAAIGAIRREMNSSKWTLFAILYQCVFAYVMALIFYQFGLVFAGGINAVGAIAATMLLAGLVYLLVRPYNEATHLNIKLKK